MAFRDTLKANLDLALASTNVSVSAELPYSSAGEPLYQKNMKHVYIDEDNISKTVLFPTLDKSDVTETTTTVTAFLSVDAKNDLSDIDTIISSILNSRNAITGQTINECEMETDIEADVLTYTFNYNFITV
tara:strand:+ start:525 stop:917 length:393 start_codon:yes stop_codon:yes gene_type:complete